MTDSVLSQPTQSKSNRLDPPHDLMLASSDEMSTPWMAMAGRDPVATSDQLDRQTSELLAYVQQQNDEIDARQSELNAKLAQLDNELRTARLRSGLDAGAELVADSSIDGSIALDEIPLTQPTEPPENPETPKTVPEMPSDPGQNARPGEFQEFEEVEKLVAQFTDTPVAPTPSHRLEVKSQETNASISKSAPHDQARQTEIDDKDPNIERLVGATKIREDRSHGNSGHGTANQAPMPFDPEGPPRESVDHFPSVLTSSHLSRVDSGVDIQAMASSLDASEMESERRLLAERKIELDRRKSVLQRMQDETQALHREALEMRLTTEQLWIELSEKAPADHVNELLASLRGRLDEHYTAQQKTIGDRKSELVDLKQLIEAKQEAIREQSSKLQEWVESRQDEIKSFAAEVDAREMLLDHREHRMREEFAKWEAQRGSYQQQLQGLLQKLNLSGIGE